MIYHLVPLADWFVRPDQPYAPASLAEAGFLHCSPDEATLFAVTEAFYRSLPGTLVALVVDEHRLEAEVRWEKADPAPPPGVPDGTLFPHVFGPINRDAVVEVREIRRDDEGRALSLEALPEQR